MSIIYEGLNEQLVREAVKKAMDKQINSIIDEEMDKLINNIKQKLAMKMPLLRTDMIKKLAPYAHHTSMTYEVSLTVKDKKNDDS